MNETGTVVSMTSTGVGAVFTAIQTNPVYQIISLVITILGLLVTIASSIVIPLIKWYHKAKADGKITKEEKEEAAQIIQNGTDQVKTEVDKINKN